MPFGGCGTNNGSTKEKRSGNSGALSAGSETRTRTTVKSQVFETSASTIPPFPHLFQGLFKVAFDFPCKVSQSPFFLSGCKFREIFLDAQQIPLFEKKISHNYQICIGSRGFCPAGKYGLNACI
jgi:hypothetical protein